MQIDKNYLISGNNQLVKEFVRAIKEINPVALLMENVKAIESDIHKFCNRTCGKYKVCV